MSLVFGRRCMSVCLALVLAIFVFTSASSAAQSYVDIEFNGDWSGIFKPREVDATDLVLSLGMMSLLLQYNESVYYSIHERFDGTAFDSMDSTISSLADAAAVGAIAGIIYLKDRETGELAISSLVRTAMTVQIIKTLAGYPRPGVNDPPSFHGPTLRRGYDSFPSGHTAAAFTLATVLSNKYPDYKEVFYVVAGLVGLSRIMTTNHWPADVFVGAVIGVTMANDTISHGKIIEIHF